MKKKYFIFIICIALVFTAFLTINATTKLETSGYQPLMSEIDTSTNFFTQVDSKEQMTIVDERDEVINKGYKKIAENNDLILYRLDASISIAVYDKHNGYMWYSSYKDYDTLVNNDSLLPALESGVIIEYYDANGSLINFSEIAFTSEKAEATVSYKDSASGFVASVKFPNQGISFDVHVSIEGGNLNVNVPYETIKEEKVKKIKKEYTYQLKAIKLFPYFGSENYRINGYSFIPDGSGALIRYDDVASSTGFIKKVYGADYGVQPQTSTSSHMKNNQTVTLPIYGVSHGYNQAAFLCEITDGDGACELHSYPYNYNNIGVNTTFFKFVTRETFIVNLSSSTKLTLINDTPYPNDYSLRYTFLNGEEANYVGMANAYRDSLGLTEKELVNEATPLHLTLLGLDYKEGLFGKNFVTMTTFENAQSMISEFKLNGGVDNFQVTYLGWNKGGYFNDGATNAKLASQLGSRNEYEELMDYINKYDYSIDFTINPLISEVYGYGNETIKMINMNSFEKTLKSSLLQKQYYNSPAALSERILDKSSRYEKLNINSFNIDNLNQSFSYRYKKDQIFRQEMIEILQDQLDLLNEYKISTSTPNGYIYRYLSNYYDTPYESSKYLYETDSIPFIQIVLSGYVDMFGPDLNYISDVELMNLRMIEYNIYPSVLLTNKEAYELRFTNFEYLNSTQFDLWKSLVVGSYDAVSNALNYVRGAQIINHQYIANGVCEVTYNNGITIYINYNNYDYSDGQLSIEPYQYMVVRG